MPNVLSIDPLRALAKRASAKIADKTIADRFERLALDQLLKDPRNFRPAKAAELTDAPAWAVEAFVRGEEVSVFRTNRALAARLHTVARRLGDTCKVAAAETAAHPDDAPKIGAAREFLAKFGRANFDTAAKKALAFSRLLLAWHDDLDATPVCEPRTIILLNGRRWSRITSVKALRAIGREFANCLARTQSIGGYGGMLAKQHAQFWVLRDYDGKGLIVAMAPGRAPTHFMEVKGPRNAHVRLDDADLRSLALAIGIRPAPPPPPPPPPPVAPPARVLEAVLAARQPCRCNLCMPRLSVRLRPRARVI
ncbi:MAG: hypothetical protein AB7H66_17085 [Hyphomonadaceae bacterium]